MARNFVGQAISYNPETQKLQVNSRPGESLGSDKINNTAKSGDIPRKEEGNPIRQSNEGGSSFNQVNKVPHKAKVNAIFFCEVI